MTSLYVFEDHSREIEPLAGAVKLNRLINRPGIIENLYPNLPKDCTLDMTARVLAPETLLAFYDDGNAGLFFPYPHTQLYEGHYLFSTLRGRNARIVAQWMTQAVFDYTPAAGIVGLVPREHRAARVMSRAIGCKPVGESVDCHGRSCITYLMER